MRVTVVDPLGGQPLSIQSHGHDTVRSFAARAARRLGLTSRRECMWTFRRNGTVLGPDVQPPARVIEDGDELELVDLVEMQLQVEEGAG